MKKIIIKPYKLFVIALVLSVFLIINRVNEVILPSALAISQLEAKATANMVVDSVMKNTIKQMQITASDFYINAETDADINTIATNTVLINRLCADLSYDINSEIKQISKEKISVPMGAATGISFLLNKGPDIDFNLMPKGGVDVDYETQFSSVGINQTNYQVWLNIEISMQIVNPLKSSHLVLKRKVALVDTLINGQVPEWYMNLQNN